MIARFKYQLLGRKFIVLTDHAPLLALSHKAVDCLSDRALRWLLELQNFTFKISHIAGALNTAADYLSRIDINDYDELNLLSRQSVEPIERSPIYVSTRARTRAQTAAESEAQTAERLLSDITNEDAENEDSDKSDGEIEDTNATRKNIKDQALQLEIIEQFHNHQLGGHLGIRKTFLRINAHYFWKNLHKMVKNYVRACEVCQKSKFHNFKKVHMGDLSIPKIPFSRIYMDICGPFPPCPENHKYVLAFQCATSNYVIAREITDKCASTIAKVLFEEVILNFGHCSEVYSGQAAELMSSVVKKTLSLLKISSQHSIIYNAQSNKVERFNASLKTYIRTFLSDKSVKK